MKFRDFIRLAATLADLVTRDSMIGVSLPQQPQPVPR
jgi:hypothetical protein